MKNYTKEIFKKIIDDEDNFKENEKWNCETRTTIDIVNGEKSEILLNKWMNVLKHVFDSFLNNFN